VCLAKPIAMVRSRARDQAGDGLHEPLRHLIGALVGIAGRVDNQCGERLQEITAESATERAGYRMTACSEVVLLRHGRYRVTADDAGDDFNDKVGQSPSHRGFFLLAFFLDCGLGPQPHAISVGSVERPQSSGFPSQQSLTRKPMSALVPAASAR
jgi:hypothetical protein